MELNSGDSGNNLKIRCINILLPRHPKIGGSVISIKQCRRRILIMLIIHTEMKEVLPLKTTKVDIQFFHKPFVQVDLFYTKKVFKVVLCRDDSLLRQILRTSLCLLCSFVIKYRHRWKSMSYLLLMSKEIFIFYVEWFFSFRVRLITLT